MVASCAEKLNSLDNLQYPDKIFLEVYQNVCVAAVFICTGVGYSSPPWIVATLTWNRFIGEYEQTIIERISWFLISFGTLFFPLYQVLTLGLIGFSVSVTFWSSPCSWSHVEIGYWISVYTVLVEWFYFFKMSNVIFGKRNA